MPDADAVLFANEAFYRAFTDRDIRGMDGVWSQTVAITCLHPGWAPLFGRDEVMASWAAILSAPGAPQVRIHAAHASLYGALASVICFENLGSALLVATNLFVREGSLWKMVHHQSGPTTTEPPLEDEPGYSPHSLN